MDYILKSAKAQGLPYEKVLNFNTPNEKVYGVNVLIKTGIVGQTHRGFENTDVGFCPILKTDTIDQSEAKIQIFATQYVATNYPNN
jgi:hypothetical protein